MVNFVEWENGDLCVDAHSATSRREHHWSKTWTKDWHPAKSCSDCGQYVIETDEAVLNRLLIKFNAELKRYSRLYQAATIPSDQIKYSKCIEETNLKIKGIEELLDEDEEFGTNYKYLVEPPEISPPTEINQDSTVGYFKISSSTEIETSISDLGGTLKEDNTKDLGGTLAGWEEIKEISGKKYRYWRWREGGKKNGKKRSKYLGKV